MIVQTGCVVLFDSLVFFRELDYSWSLLFVVVAVFVVYLLF